MIIFIKLEIFLSSRNLPQNGEDCDVQNKKYYGWGGGEGGYVFRMVKMEFLLCIS